MSRIPDPARVPFVRASRRGRAIPFATCAMAAAAMGAPSWALGAEPMTVALGVAPLVLPPDPLAKATSELIVRWRQEAIALERGNTGMPKDPARAATLYCQAARHGDAEAQFALAEMLAYGRGIARDDAAASHLVAAAAAKGVVPPEKLAVQLGAPSGEVPACLRPPVPPALPVAAPIAEEPSSVAVAPRTAVGPLAPSASPTPPSEPIRPALLAPAPKHRLYDEAPAAIVRYVKLMAPQYKLAPQLVLAIMAAESNFNASALSPKQAQGLMQLIPETAARFNVKDIADPVQNIRGGMAYLRWLMAFFEGNTELAIAAYNAGERAVEKHKGIPPFAETQAYVKKVMGLVGEDATHPFDPKAAPASPVLAEIRRLAQKLPIGLPVAAAPSRTSSR